MDEPRYHTTQVVYADKRPLGILWDGWTVLDIEAGCTVAFTEKFEEAYEIAGRYNRGH
jgi:hypothetical protein